MILGIVSLFALAPTSLCAQKPDKLSAVAKIYVESLGQTRRAEDTRNHLIHHLEHDFQIVTDAVKASASLKGTAQIWSTGEVTLSPHSHSANEAVLEGYLSVELIGKDNQTLWSYLATPSKFPWSGIADDLARQTAAKLVQDVRKGGPSTAPEISPTFSGGTSQLKGAGATFPAPLYRKWLQSFQELHPGAHISYDAVGSGEGIRLASDGQIDFGASDMPLTDEALFSARHHFDQVPIVLGAVVPIYNLPGIHHRLDFTPKILAGIYLGKIMKWNDPQILSANPHANLPNEPITVVHRSDASGTSFVFSDYLAKVSAEWKSAVGAGVSVKWPVGTGAEYNDGVAATVQRTPNSIGYVEFIYAIQHELSFGAVRNAAGVFVKADLASVTEAARSAGVPPSGFRLSITDAPGKSSYPIASYTWLLLPAQEDRDRKATLLDLLRWMLSSGQKSCSGLGYAPLPPDVARNALQAAEQLLTEPSRQSNANK